MNKTSAIILLVFSFLHCFSLNACSEETYSITANVTDMGKMCYITGTVKDSQGNAIHPAEVTFEGCSLKTTVETLPGGYFIFNPPPCLDYKITARAPSGLSAIQEAAVAADEILPVNLTLDEMVMLKEAIYILGSLTGMEVAEVPGDLTGDGRVGIEDAIHALQLVAGEQGSAPQKIFSRRAQQNETYPQIEVMKDSDGDGVYDEDWSLNATIDEYGNIEVNNLTNGIYSITVTSSDDQSAVSVRYIKIEGRDINIKGIQLKPLGQISGNVKLEGAEDNSDIHVTVQGTSLSALSDVNGDFTLLSVPEGTYDIRLSRSSFGTVILEDIPVLSEIETAIGNVTLTSTAASVHGTAQSAGESDHSGNLIMLRALTGNSFISGTIADGSYEFSDIPAGEYLISILPFSPLHSSYSETLILDQGENNLDTVILPLLGPGDTGILTGAVTLDYESEDHGGVLVSIGGSRLMAVTDSSGHYEITGLPAGTCTVFMDREGFRAHKEENVQITGDEETVLDVTLSLQSAEAGYINCGSVLGSASYSDQESGAGIAVKIEGTDIPLAGTDTNGAFIINNVPPGTYTVTFTQSNYRTVTRTGVIVPPWNTVELEPVTMIPPVGEISGKVELEGQTSHYNVTIALDGTDIDAQTSSNGQFILTSIPEGSYTLTAYRDGFDRVEIQNVQVTAGRRTILVETVFIAAAPEPATGVKAVYASDTSVKIEWTASVSDDVAGYDIYYGVAQDQLLNPANSELITSQVEGKWMYVVENLTSGETYWFSVKAVDDDGLESGFATPATPLAMGEIQGFAQTEDSNNGNITVSLEGTSINAQTNTIGFYTLSSVPPGTYTITAYKAGYSTARLDNIVINPGQTRTLFTEGDEYILMVAAPPEPPTGLAASQTSGSSINVAWTASLSADVIGYNVYYGTDSSNITELSNQDLIASDIRQYEVTGLQKGVPYYFAVKAKDDDDLYSAPSQYVQTEIIPKSPVPPNPSEILEGGDLFDNPDQICISRDGLKGYVTNRSAGVVSLIDLQTDSVTGTIPVGQAPSDVVSNPQRDEVYCVNSESNSITIIDSTKNDPALAVISTISTSANPSRAHVSHDGKYLFVTCVGADCVNIIDLDSDTRTEIPDSPVSVGNDPAGMAIAANKLYVVNEYGNNLSVIDIMEGSDTRWKKKAYNIPVGASPSDVIARPDGAFVYVTNTGDDTISIIDTGTDQVIATPTVGDYPYGLAAYGYMLYITNYNSGTVSMINTDTNKVLGSTVTVGNYPIGIAISSDGEKIYIVNYGSGSVSIRGY